MADKDAVEVVDEADEVEESEENFMTPSEIAEAVNRDPKQIRAYLRKEHPRALEMKNSRWAIPEELGNEVIDHFESLNKAKAKPETDAANDSEDSDES